MWVDDYYVEKNVKVRKSRIVKIDIIIYSNIYWECKQEIQIIFIKIEEHKTTIKKYNK